MTAVSSTQLFLAVLAIALFSHAAGHSYMTSPISRSNQAQTNSGCRGPECMGPCDIPLSKAKRAPIVASRGTSIRVDWPRNNHAGGFIRFAWAPTSQSDDHSAFDNHVQQINCHEIGNPTPGQCAPSDPVNDINGGGSGPGDGSFGACNTNITVPLDLTDGLWTLQWAWFGGAFSLGDYYSCADYQISGGAVGKLTPVFIGGDFSYPNQQKCKFFNTDKLHVCTSEPCQKPIYTAYQAQSGAPAAGQLGSNIVISTPVPTPVQASTTGRVQVAPTPVPVPVPVPTPVQVPVPVPVQVPIPVTTPVPQIPVKSTTGQVQVPVPVSAPTPSGSNCAGATSVSSSTARIAALDTWGSQFHALIEITVAEAVLSDWVLEVTFPFTTRVVNYFNGGALQCSDSTRAYFMPVASWSNNKSVGSTIQIEFVAADTGSSQAFLASNIGLRVLKH